MGTSKQSSSSAEHKDERVVLDDSLLEKVEIAKVIDLILSKQTQYYTLWGVYTAVQFAVGGFGNTQHLTGPIVVAVLLGVWVFNLGHLSFVLQCVAQIKNLSAVLTAGLEKGKEEYLSSLRVALKDVDAAAFIWRLGWCGKHRNSYVLNTMVHLVIDICASVALVLRVIG